MFIIGFVFGFVIGMSFIAWVFIENLKTKDMTWEDGKLQMIERHSDLKKRC